MAAGGSVWKAFDRRLSRLVALKILNFGLELSDRGVERFKREAATTAKLNHPGLCAVYEAGRIAGQSFIAMRYVEGETLASRISKSKMTPATGVFTRFQIGVDREVGRTLMSKRITSKNVSVSSPGAMPDASGDERVFGSATSRSFL